MEYDVLEGFWGDAGESIDAYYAVNDFVRANGANHDVIDGSSADPAARASRTSAAGCMELRRESALPKPTRQTNISFSRAGVIRGLHYHERGQDDLFCCLRAWRASSSSTARPARRSPRTSATTTRSPSTIPGQPRARLRGADRRALLLPRDRGVRPRRPGRARDPLGRPARRRPVETTVADPLRARYPRVLITGAGGQLGTALAEVFPGRTPSAAASSTSSARCRPRLRPHPARGRLDGRRRRGVRPGGRGGRRTSSARGTSSPAARRSSTSRPTTSSTGRRREPYLESDEPEPARRSTGGRSSPASARCGTAGSSARPGSSARRATTSSARCSGSAAKRDEVRVVDDQRGSPTYVGHLAAATRGVLDLPYGIYHVAADGDCTWADFAEAIFAERGLDARPAGSRPRSSVGRLRARRTRCSAREHAGDAAAAELATGSAASAWLGFARERCSSPAGPGSSAPTSRSGSPRRATRSSSSTS